MNRETGDISILLAEAGRVPQAGACLICQMPLGAEPHFITQLPDGEHVACREQRYLGNDFPHAGQLASLRRLAVLLRCQYRVVVETGRWLAAIKYGWPGTQDAFEMDRMERLTILEKGLNVLKEELSRRGQQNWF